MERSTSFSADRRLYALAKLTFLVGALRLVFALAVLAGALINAEAGWLYSPRYLGWCVAGDNGWHDRQSPDQTNVGRFGIVSNAALNNVVVYVGIAF